MRISDWSSDVCSSDLPHGRRGVTLISYPSAASPDCSATGDGLMTKGDGGMLRRHDRRVLLGLRCRARRPAAADRTRRNPHAEIAKAPWRERACPYGTISAVAVSLQQKRNTQK